jgi:hypothetical protein
MFDVRVAAARGHSVSRLVKSCCWRSSRVRSPASDYYFNNQLQRVRVPWSHASCASYCWLVAYSHLFRTKLCTLFPHHEALRVDLCSEAFGRSTLQFCETMTILELSTLDTYALNRQTSELTAVSSTRLFRAVRDGVSFQQVFASVNILSAATRSHLASRNKCQTNVVYKMHVGRHNQNSDALIVRAYLHLHLMCCLY